jgi:hypothetical protein
MINLEQIQQTIQEIYLKNITFLKQYDRILYDRIVSFEKQNKEDYYIGFDNNHFELYDKNDKKTYNCDPFYDAKYRADNIDKSISGIFTIDLKCRKVDNDDIYDSNKFINEYISLYENKDINNNLKYKKFIFFGALLGVHLNDISNRTKSEAYLIIEENIEIFRLSLFMTDYGDIALNSKLYFAIELNSNDLDKKIEEFLEFKYHYNYFIKYEIASDSAINILEKTSNIIASYSPTIYPYSQIMRSYINGLNNIKKVNTGILKLKNRLNILKNKKVLFLAPGPSLKNNIDIIKANQDKFIIVIAISAIKRMAEQDIIPDIIISIDSDRFVLENFTINDKYYRNSLVIASMNTNNEVLNKVNSSNLFLFQNSLTISKECRSFTGVTVGDVGVKILLQLGVTQLYLCGIDAALDQKSGSTHDNTHISSTKKKLKVSTVLEDENIDFANRTIEVKGNLKDKVYTTVYYKTIIDSFKQIDKKHDVKIFNLSDNGAFLDKTIPSDFNSIDVTSFSKIKKSIIKNELLGCFNQNIKQNITEEDKRYLNALVPQIIERYNRLILPFYYFILDNNMVDNKKLMSIKSKQVESIRNLLRFTN